MPMKHRLAERHREMGDRHCKTVPENVGCH
jgi:hypothetical protein